MNINLLEKLRAAAPDWVSSEQLRQPSGVSRAAISKQIKGLQALGYEIESSPRKGYRFLRDPDRLQSEVILPFLAETRFAAGPFVFNEVTASTNDDCRQLAEQGAGEGAVVLAEVQEQGRGRRGRRWFGRAGDCLQFSVLVASAHQSAARHSDSFVGRNLGCPGAQSSRGGRRGHQVAE